MIKHYILDSDEKHKLKMFELYQLIIDNSPPLKESMKWGMPTFELNRNLIHFARAKNHIGLYPSPSGVKFVEDELIKKAYKYSKGAIQLPLDKPLDTDLILKILQFRIEENQSS